MGHIDWIPIADMPDGLKDGREVLIGWWERNLGLTFNPRPDEWASVVCVWSDWGQGRGDWQLAQAGAHAEDCNIDGDPTHFAEINPPNS